MKSVLLTSLAAFLWTGQALAQNASVPGPLELYPTLEAIGARLAYTGDANANATAWLEWRTAGATAWTPGMPMTRITNQRWAASVLWLAPGTAYEVRAVIEDADGGGSVTGTATTRRDTPRAPTGRSWWVSPAGNDAAAGTSTAPLRTISAAAARVQPGEEIRVRPGVYYETVDPNTSGRADAPIWLVADAPGVILDGSDPALLSRTDWTNDGGGVFSVPFTGATRLVCADSLQRLYRQATLAALRANGNGITQGWVIEAGRLYVKLEDGSSPAGHVMHVARQDVGVYLDVSHWVVQGFEVRYYGTTSAASGIYLRAANGCAVMGNHVHTIGGKSVYLRVNSADNVIESNLLRDPRIGTWPWSATKAHEEEQQGVSHRGGRGNVIRRNVVRGIFDGIDVAAGETDENVGSDCDLSENLIKHCADDALEPETISGINVRVWKNEVDSVYSGMSIAPNYQGPTYVFYNTFTNYQRGGLKFSLSGTGQTFFYHNTLTSNWNGAPAVHPSGPYSNIHWRNNIMVGNNSASVSDDAGESQAGCSFDGDLIHSNYAALFRWKGVNYSTIAALRSALGFELNGRSGDPMFTSVTGRDLTLRLGSPAIDAAIRLPGVNDRYFGLGPDIGAHESGSGVDVTPPAAIIDLREG